MIETSGIRKLLSLTVERPKSALTVLVLAAMLVFTIILAFQEKPASATVVVAAGAISMAFLNLDRFQSFKGAGFEAVMREAQNVVDEGNRTLEQLKEFASEITNVTANLVAIQGYLDAIDVEDKVELRQRLAAQLSKLGVEAGSVDQRLSLLDTTVLNEHLDRIGEGVKGDENLCAVFDQLRSQPGLPQRLLETVQESRPEYRQGLNELLADYEFYVEHKRLRRPRTWKAEEPKRFGQTDFTALFDQALSGATIDAGYLEPDAEKDAS